MQRDPVTAPETTLRLGLALQGGGSHGAFGWGVLHELLEAGDHRDRGAQWHQRRCSQRRCLRRRLIEPSR